MKCQQYKIAGLGEVLWDIYGEEKFLGGAPANFVAHVLQAGHQGLVLSRVGQDKLGHELIRRLEEMHLITNYIQVDPFHPTGTVLVTLDTSGVPSFQCTQNVAFDHLEFDKHWREVAPSLDAVLFGTLAQRSDKSRHAIMTFLDAAVNAIKIFDMNLRVWNDMTRSIVKTSLQKADIVKLNLEELRILSQVFDNPDPSNLVPKLIVEYNLKLVVVTRGEDGAIVWNEKEHYNSPGYKVHVVDTTGAGDAFAAGLVVKLLENASLEEMAEFANLLGAFVATRKGAVPCWSGDDLEVIRQANKPRTNL